MLQLRRVSATANSRRRFWGVLDFASGVLVVDFHYFQYFDATSSTKSSRATRQMTWTERSTTTTAPAPVTATSSAASRSIGRPVRVLLRKENLTFFSVWCVSSTTLENGVGSVPRRRQHGRPLRASKTATRVGYWTEFLFLLSTFCINAAFIGVCCGDDVQNTRPAPRPSSSGRPSSNR